MPAIAGAVGHTADSLQPVTRTGREIYANFREGLSDPECAADASDRWRQHFAHVPRDLAGNPDKLLPLFGYVVDALRAYDMPTEYALIPFVESGYRPGARSPSGPAGLWQFIAVTARNHKIAIRPGYDGRLSPAESTTAAVRYLRTLHGMFAGDWRLAVMGYNAGEYRIFGALRNAGQQAMNADPDALAVPGITRAYVRKLQALSCLLVEAGEHQDWLDAIDHVVPVLTEAPLPVNARHLDAWSTRNGHDAALVRRFNPAFPDGRVASADRNLRVLVPARPEYAVAGLQAHPLPATSVVAQLPPGQPRHGGDTGAHLADASALDDTGDTGAAATATTAHARTGSRTHTVVRGDSIWRIARRYGISSAQLLLRNGLGAGTMLQPGMVLSIDDPSTAEAGTVAN